MDIQGTSARIQSDPGLPNPRPTRSHWMSESPFPELRNIQSPKLPADADIVIIGSGITGAGVAEHLLQTWQLLGASNRTNKIVVLEARTLCSGATGRNGGQAKPALWEAWGPLANRIGTERAAKVVDFQRANVDALLQASRLSDARAKWAECRSVDAMTLFLPGSEKMWHHARQAIGEQRLMQRQGSKFVDELTVWDAEKGETEFEACPAAMGAFSYAAAALSPYNFVMATFRTLLCEFPEQLFLEAHTPAMSIQVDEGGSSLRPYTVNTPRGPVRTRHIVHATNAFASHLLPGMRSKITGARAHMTAQQVPSTLHEPIFRHHGRERSWGLLHGQGVDYMIERRLASMPDEPYVLLGGGQYRSANGGVDQMGVWDDGKVDTLTVAHLAGIIPAMSMSGKQQGSDIVHATTICSAWSGIIAITADALPFVGRLSRDFTGRDSPERDDPLSVTSTPGEWISAGYNGEGMVYAWLCSMALARMICGAEAIQFDEEEARARGQRAACVADWLPKELIISSERLQGQEVACVSG